MIDVRAERPIPPPTEARPITESLHGVRLTDPYRWLEDRDTPDTRRWIDAQNVYTDAYFSTLPDDAALRTLVKQLLEVDEISLPIVRDDRYFLWRREAKQQLGVLYVRNGVDGPDRVLIDPHPLSEDHTTSVAFREVSRDGALAVYSIRHGGADEVEVRIRNVDTGVDLPDLLPTDRYGSVAMTPDKRGFYYSRYGDDHPRVLYHALGTEAGDDVEVFGDGYDSRHIFSCRLSHDGRWLVVQVYTGSSGFNEIYIKDLSRDGDFVTVLNDGKSQAEIALAGDHLAIITDHEAPNRRLVIAEFARAGVEHWKQIIPERPDVVLDDVAAVGGRLVVFGIRNVQSLVAMYDLEGSHLRDVEVGTIGTISGGAGEWDGDEIFFSFSSYNTPRTIYRQRIARAETAVWARAQIPIDSDQIVIKQEYCTSKDGTQVPMFIVHRRDIAVDGDRPTMMYGYGGFNAALMPRFNEMVAAWVELGGVSVTVNLRGGGEFGEAWHRAGMFDKKQNVFDDFIAAAEHLIAAGYTQPKRLGIIGGSNGGLLVGAVMTQRPDLFGAVICSYPLLDMVRYHRFLVARFWISEYGSSDDPAQFKYLLDYSPYHHVEAGIAYPATLLITGDADTRVDPLHARKMAALLQSHNGSSNPILLRYHTKAGHSGGQPLSDQIDDLVERLRFLRWRLGE